MPHKVVAEAKEMGQKYSGTVVAIGKFEGVHRGHQMIIDRLDEVASQNRYGSVVLTFNNNPLSVLKPEICPFPLMSPQQRAEALTSRGVNEVLMIPFTKEFANESAEQFVQTYLIDALGAKHVIVGEDFRFGEGAKGNANMLKQIGAESGFTVEVIEEVTDLDNIRISSSLIRDLLDEGDVALAHRLLGHPHAVRGVVVHGDARGRELGFPTANLGPAGQSETLEGFVPSDGVYAGKAEVLGKQYLAAISIGNNPTFTPRAQSRVEAYLLDFDQKIYGEEIEIHFYERVRLTEKFDSVEALITQMHADVNKVRQFFS